MEKSETLKIFFVICKLQFRRRFSSLLLSFRYQKRIILTYIYKTIRLLQVDVEPEETEKTHLDI